MHALDWLWMDEPMNEHEIERIAAAFHALRPDWPASSLRTMLTKRAQHMPRRDVCVMLAWIACDNASSTPARMFETGPWKRAAAVEGRQSPRMTPVRDRCDVCGQGEHMPTDHNYQPTDPRRDCDTSTEVAHLRGLIRKDESA
jgi:hypothetical protein